MAASGISTDHLLPECILASLATSLLTSNVVSNMPVSGIPALLINIGRENRDASKTNPSLPENFLMSFMGLVGGTKAKPWHRPA